MAEPKKNKKWEAFKSKFSLGKSKSTPCKKVDVKKKAAHFALPPRPPLNDAYLQLKANPYEFLKQNILEVSGSSKEGVVHSMKFYFNNGKYFICDKDEPKFKYAGIKESIDVDMFDVPMLKGWGDNKPDFKVDKIEAVFLKKDSPVTIMSTPQLTACSFVTQLYEGKKGVEYLCAHIQPRTGESKEIGGKVYNLEDVEGLQNYIKDHGKIDITDHDEIDKQVVAGKMVVWGPRNYRGYGGRPKLNENGGWVDCSTVIGFLDKINNKWDIYFQIWNPSKEIVAVERLETVL